MNNWMNMQPWGQQWGWDDWDYGDDWDDASGLGSWDPSGWGWRRPRRRRRRRVYPPIFRPPFGKFWPPFGKWGKGGGY